MAVLLHSTAVLTSLQRRCTTRWLLHSKAVDESGRWRSRNRHAGLSAVHSVESGRECTASVQSLHHHRVVEQHLLLLLLLLLPKFLLLPLLLLSSVCGRRGG